MRPLNRQSEPEFPESLRRALQAADDPGFSVPPAIGDAVRQAASKRLAAVRSQRRLRRWIPAWAAAAAAVLLLVIAPPLQTSREAARTRAKVTILEAFSLARQLKANNSPGREWDYNADGVVDRRDVDALARAAVRLEDGT